MRLNLFDRLPIRRQMKHFAPAGTVRRQFPAKRNREPVPPEGAGDRYMLPKRGSERLRLLRPAQKKNGNLQISPPELPDHEQMLRRARRLRTAVQRDAEPESAAFSERQGADLRGKVGERSEPGDARPGGSGFE